MSILFILASAIALPLSPPLPMVAGIQLGAPLDLPACSGGLAVYRTEQSRLCVDAAGVGNRRTIYFPIASMPLIAGAPFGSVQIAGNVVAKVGFATLGYANERAIVDQICAKFGKVSGQRTENRMMNGIAVPVTTYNWNRAGFVATYDNVGNDVAYGVFEVKMDILQKSDDAATQHDRDGRIPL